MIYAQELGNIEVKHPHVFRDVLLLNREAELLLRSLDLLGRKSVEQFWVRGIHEAESVSVLVRPVEVESGYEGVRRELAPSV